MWAYKFDSFDKDAGIVTYQANENYWGGMPAIEYHPAEDVQESDAMMLAFQKGEIDLPYYYSQRDYYYLCFPNC
jgi:peptide/nickel transport system substrate-binding protein